MEVELDLRRVLQIIKQLKCKITESIFEVVMIFDDRWLPESGNANVSRWKRCET